MHKFLSSCPALYMVYMNCFSFSHSTFIDLVDSEESDKRSDEENTKFMDMQNAIALSFQKSR